MIKCKHTNYVDTIYTQWYSDTVLYVSAQYMYMYMYIQKSDSQFSD